MTEAQFNTTQSVAIILTLLITLYQIRSSVKVNQFGARLSITASHREIWLYGMSDPEIIRVLQKDVDVEKNPITFKERMFVVLIINHMNMVYEAHRRGVLQIPSPNFRDVENFLSLPIPREVWRQVHKVHNKNFVSFIESIIYKGFPK